MSVSRAFFRKLTVTVNVMRPTAAVAGTDAATPVLSGILCTPLDPVSPELAARDGFAPPYALLQTFTPSSGIKHGDFIAPTNGFHAGRQLPVVSVAAWDGMGGFWNVKCEDVKR